tara:strand:+ start:77 stop:325 length:249 start_codon:yes stop_codon:yes gene_type:complete
MVFKGEAKGIEFSLDGQRIISADPVFKKEMEMAISLGVFGRAANKRGFENTVGKAIVKKFSGKIIHDSDIPTDDSPQPQLIY